jgi:hypothetical protein
MGVFVEGIMPPWTRWPLMVFRCGADSKDGHKAVAADDSVTEHLIIGLNRENVESLLRGDVFTLPRGVFL